MELNRINSLFKPKWVLLILSLLVFVVYANSFGNAFVSDDIASIVANPYIGELSAVFANLLSFLRPLVYWFIYHIFGLHPIGFRIINLLFHLGTAWLTYCLVIRITKKEILAFITAVLFTIHPILTESVTWISGGGYPQYSFLVVLGILLYYLSENNVKFYILSFFVFILSLVSSEKAVIFPLLILLLDISFRSNKFNLVKLSPFFLTSLFFGVGLLKNVGSRVSVLQSTYYQSPEGPANLLLTIPVAISSYVELLFWPNSLALYHSEMMLSTLGFIFRVGICLILLIGLGFSFFKNKKVFFGLGFFLISLIPTLTPWGISWIVAERYVYLGSIGIFFIVGIFFNWLIQKNKGLGWVLLIMVLVSLSIRTIVRNTDWKNQDTLWVSMIRTSPSSPQNHNNLGDMYGRQGNMNQAILEFQKAIELNPQYGDAYHNLGNIYQQTQKYDLAIQSFEKAISFNPNLWQSYANIGAIYYQQKNYQYAEANLLKAIEIIPSNDNLYAGLGVVYLEQNQKSNATAVFKRALEINPENEIARTGIGGISDTEYQILDIRY